MTTTQSERELDTVIQQSWKRMRSTEEIRSFLARRVAALENCEVELGF